MHVVLHSLCMHGMHVMPLYNTAARTDNACVLLSLCPHFARFFFNLTQNLLHLERNGCHPLDSSQQGASIAAKKSGKDTFFAELALFELQNEAQLRFTLTRAIPNLGVFQFRRSEQAVRTLVGMAHPKRAQLVLKKNCFAFCSCGGARTFLETLNKNSFFQFLRERLGIGRAIACHWKALSARLKKEKRIGARK